MREKINRLALGIIDMEIPEIMVTPRAFDEAVRAGTTIKKEVFLSSSNNLHIKGLAYSTDIRVKVLNKTFGGLRNHVNYEINTRYLVNGDIIKGSFHLITNGGEKEVPFLFRVEYDGSGQTLTGLESAADFCLLAMEDYETALRLFEYHDFPAAPFMQDMHTRAVYEGLKGRGDRQNLLEEFLVALKAKNPVEVTIEAGKRVYENPAQLIEDKIAIAKSGWGYLNIEAEADGEFISIPKRIIGETDFSGDNYEFIYQINPYFLHKGKNMGKICLISAQGQSCIEIEVFGDTAAEFSQKGKGEYKSGLERYLSLRIDFESGLHESGPLAGKMLRELEALIEIRGKEDILMLLQAELYLQTDRLEQACLLLDECRASVLADRQEQVEIYCFYQYLNLLTQPGEVQAESLIRLIYKYLTEEETLFYLFFLLLKLDPSLGENPGSLLVRMKQMHKLGCRSPFLYLEACRLYEEIPGLLRGMDSFELQSVYFGARYHLISRGLALKIGKLAGAVKSFQKLLYHLLSLLYEIYPENELLEPLLGMLIKGDCRDTKYFRWYEKGVEEGIGLTKLYDYYLFSLPENYDRLLPREVLLYFSYDHQMNRHGRAVLYRNMIQYMDKSESLYREFEREMEKFAMEELFQSRINSCLAVVYDNMIYRDIIDVPIAMVLPSVLRSYKIECSQSRMKYVIISHEELVDADAFPIQNGVAYVPLFSEHSVILFQDGFGNRYANIPFKKTRVMDRPELEQKCFEVYPGHSMLRLLACRTVVESGAADDYQVMVLEKALGELKLTPLFKEQMLSVIISYYRKRTAVEKGEGDSALGGTGGYLLYLDKALMNRTERAGVCETLINQNYHKEAYEMIREYGCEEIQPERIIKLCSKLILQKQPDQNQELLSLVCQAYQAGQSGESGTCDHVILDYLCRNFNGTTDQMYHVLRLGVRDHVETYDMEERLTAQMIFSGATQKLDQVFDLYATRKRADESIVKAFFTTKSIEYFLLEKPASDNVFMYLEGAIGGSVEKELVPLIYLLSLTKYYSTVQELNDKQKEICRKGFGVIQREGMVFPYFKALSRHISIPEEVLDKGMIEYHGRKDSRIDLQIRILPEEEAFHSEDIRRMFQGIFVKQKILFEGEIMEYRIYENQNDVSVLATEGRITCGDKRKWESAPYLRLAEAERGISQFDSLNNMGLCLRIKDEAGLQKKMKEYMIKMAEVEELFQLM